MLGWGVERDDVAQVIRWHECSARTECTALLRERSSAHLEGVDTLGTTTVQVPNGEVKIVEVQQLHFAPVPPNRLQLSTEVRARMEEAAPDPLP